MIRKKTSINIDPLMWKEVKKKCIDQDIDISQYLENLINKDLNKIRNQV